MLGQCLVNRPLPWAESFCPRADALRWRFGSDANLLAVSKIDGRRQDHLVAVLDARVHLDRRAEVTHQLTFCRWAFPSSTTATLRPLALKMIASDGRTSDGVLRGISSSTLQ